MQKYASFYLPEKRFSIFAMKLF